MTSAESPVPAPGLDLSALLIALTVLVSFLLALAALHFLLKKLCSRIHPSIPQTAQAYHGVDEEVLSSIPVQAYSKDHKFLCSKYQHECSVCLSGLEEGEPVRFLPNCRHVFHVQCIDTWFAAHTTCPFCRSEITAAESFVVPVEVNEGSSASLNRDGGYHKCNSLLCPSDSRLMSFREKLRLKRCLSLDSSSVQYASCNEFLFN